MQSAHRAWTLYQGRREIDTVFYDRNCSPEYVARGLQEHDGLRFDRMESEGTIYDAAGRPLYHTRKA